MPRRPPLPSASLRRLQRHRPGRYLSEARSLDNLISVAGLVRRPVTDSDGRELGRIADVVVTWDSSPYPSVTGIVIRIVRRMAFVHAGQIDQFTAGGVRLGSVRIDLSDFRHRDGEVALAGDVIDHQLVDVDGVRVVRASDVYLAVVGEAVRLVAADVGLQSLLRRLGPKRWRTRTTPDRVIDWAAIQPFSGSARDVHLARPNQDLHRLRPSELADLLEELGRSQRQELLAALDVDVAADVLEEMEPDDVEAVLLDASADHAAAMVAGMEPDEGAEALRELDPQRQAELLDAMPPESAAALRALLQHELGTAGSVMTSHIVLAHMDDTVGTVRRTLQEEEGHREDIDAVLIVDAAGVLVDDLRLFELLVAEHSQRVSTLVSAPQPLTVLPDTPLGDVVEQFTDARGSSIVVVDEEHRPVGRILADDLVDALIPTRGRSHFTRVLR